MKQCVQFLLKRCTHILLYTYNIYDFILQLYEGEKKNNDKIIT